MTRIMNFTAKPVRKQLRNRPKEKQKRANPHNFFIKSPQYVPYNSIWEDTSFVSGESTYMEEFYVCGSNFTEKRLYYRKR